MRSQRCRLAITSSRAGSPAAAAGAANKADKMNRLKNRRGDIKTPGKIQVPRTGNIMDFRPLMLWWRFQNWPRRVPDRDQKTQFEQTSGAGRRRGAGAGRWLFRG